MPSYDYRCTHCDMEFEARHSMAADRPPCPRCGGEPTHIFRSVPAIHGRMARGREEAVRSLEPASGSGRHGPRCPCCH